MSADKPVKWTDQQQRAILARGGNVFVTASAGTGKTAVLSGRCINLVSEKPVCPDVLSMLVLTFTEAAAEQMHARIAQQLREAYRQTRDTRLLRQLVLLQGANISTIHSFCKRLITEHFHKLALDPSFRVIDGDEAMLLKGETLEETIEWAWQQNHLIQGLHELLFRRDLRGRDGFLDSVIRLGEFLEGVAAPDVWCDRARRLAEQPDPTAGELGARQQRIVKQSLGSILDQLRLAKTLYDDEAPGGDWGRVLQETCIDPVAACLHCLDAGNWPGCAERIRRFSKPRFRSPKGPPELVAQVITELRTNAVSAFLDLKDLAILNPDYLDIVGRSTSLQTQVLIELVRRFRHVYTRRKNTLKGLDFADLEHCALRLLTVPDASGECLSPSETALALRRRFQHIFVDEYQDINPVQQAILDALSSGSNVFGVGDVKQSIYGWRGAEPTIFLDLLRPASASPKDPACGFRVDLNYNFRSAKGILDFVNHIFGRIMTEEIAHVNYDDAARLQPAPEAQTSAEGSPIVELHVLDERGRRSAQDEDDTGAGAQDSDASDSQPAARPEPEGLALVNARQRQAALIARRIREMVGAEMGRPEFNVQDRHTGESRPVQYRDIVILMRSLAHKANDYVEILRLAGIPVNCDATAGYFEATEVRDMLALLKVLDNPLRDIELATVLRSALFNVTDTELARIRLHGNTKTRHANFHACAMSYLEDGPDVELRGRLRRTFDRLETWRGVARRGHLATLIWRIYRQSGFLAFVSALPNGQARKANLLRLHDRAVQFEGFASTMGVASLTRFVDFLERLQAADQDWAPAQPGSAADNAVRILSVHKSKGLEFPVVFLAELETQFNRQDLYADMVANLDEAVGLQVIEPRSNTKLRSQAHEVIGERKLAASVAEEMRVLYVATTRARDRLILTASQKGTDCGRVLANGLLLGGATIPAWLLRPCRNAFEWVLHGFCDQRVLHLAFRTGLADRARDSGLCDFRLHEGDALRDLSQSVLALRSGKAKSAFLTRPQVSDKGEGQKMLEQVKRALSYQYPFVRAIHLAAKSSVTKLTHQDDMFVQRDYSEALDRRPAILSASGLETAGSRLAREVGTAAHLVVSKLDLKRPVTLNTIEEMRDRLVKEGAIPASIAGEVDTKAILAFFESELGSPACDERNTAWQEWPFTFGLRACEPNDSGARTSGAPNEIIVVQGVIDLLVQTPEGLLVIDFKTDHVSGDDIARRAESYRGQLELYARAAAAIRRDKVLARWLYFFGPRQAVQV